MCNYNSALRDDTDIAQGYSRSVHHRCRMKPLGTPFNLTEGAALLSLIGRLTGYTPRWFTYFIGDAHVYENHLDMLNEQLTREPFPMPKLVISDRVPEFAKTGVYQPEWLGMIEPGDFSLEGYQHHAPMTAPMAV
ncbi:thymidylate synthase [Pseudomonas bubulae]|uniref:thymidylate synthase n=1 Tax=Pseudomonas bubulae TaxID=2316085 RepID=UPI003D087925